MAGARSNDRGADGPGAGAPAGPHRGDLGFEVVDLSQPLNRSGSDYAAGAGRPGSFEFAEDTVLLPTHIVNPVAVL